MGVFPGYTCPIQALLNGVTRTTLSRSDKWQLGRPRDNSFNPFATGDTLLCDWRFDTAYTSNGYTLIQEFLVILKRSLHTYQKILRECFLGTDSSYESWSCICVDGVSLLRGDSCHYFLRIVYFERVAAAW